MNKKDKRLDCWKKKTTCLLIRYEKGHVIDNRKNDCNNCSKCGWNMAVNERRKGEAQNEYMEKADTNPVRVKRT